MDDNISMEEALKRAEGMTFEKFWVMLMESKAEFDAKMAKSREEFDAKMAKSREESEKEFRELKESQKETAKQIKELSKNIGGVNNRLGRLTEVMFSAKLWQKLEAYGYEFSCQAHHRKFVENRLVIAEADYWLENGDYVMPIEVKTELTADFVDEHIERIEIIRGYMDKRKDARKLVGAVAGGIIPDNVLKYAQRKGLYVFIQTGDTVEIAEPPQGFKAREW